MRRSVPIQFYFKTIFLCFLAHASMDGSSGGGTGNVHYGVESPPQFSRHIRADSETSSDMTPLISSRSSFNIHHDQTNSGKSIFKKNTKAI